MKIRGKTGKKIHTITIDVTDTGLVDLLEDTFSEFSTQGMCPQCQSILISKAIREDVSKTDIDFKCYCRGCGCKFVESHKLVFTSQSIGNLIIPAKKERHNNG